MPEEQTPPGRRSAHRKGDDPETKRRFRDLYVRGATSTSAARPLRPRRDLYVRGATNKRITLELGLSDRVIKRMRREMDLPKRRTEAGEDGARAEG